MSSIEHTCLIAIVLVSDTVASSSLHAFFLCHFGWSVFDSTLFGLSKGGGVGVLEDFLMNMNLVARKLFPQMETHEVHLSRLSSHSQIMEYYFTMNYSQSEIILGIDLPMQLPGWF